MPSNHSECNEQSWTKTLMRLRIKDTQFVKEVEHEIHVCIIEGIIIVNVCKVRQPFALTVFSRSMPDTVICCRQPEVSYS